MEGFPPRRPSGGADLPPQPPPPPHQSYWYPPHHHPPPPPPASSSSPHPPHPPPPYSAPSYHHYPPPQPQPHSQQWLAPPYAPQPQPQPPPYGPGPAPPHPYPPGPPPPMPPRPPQQMAPYPPPNQAWTNQPWAPNQGQHYPGTSIPQNEGEDWAARAKAWAASKSTAEGQNGRPVDHSYLQQKEGNHVNGEMSLASSQNINTGVAVAAVGADPATLVSPAKHYESAIYEQEVPSYSSSQGNKDMLGRYDNSQDYQPLAVPPVQDRFYHQPPDPSYMVNYGHNAHSGAVGGPGHDPVTAPHVWAPPGSAGPYQPPTLPALPAQQYDISTAVHSSMPVPNYGPPNIPPAAFNAPPVASHLNAELFHGDPAALNQVNQPKKSTVPSWLREEILKKKTTTENNISAQVGSDDGERSPEPTDQKDSKSLDSNKSAEEEDDEDEVEAARTLAINQEIKRILTEVLLKVTDDLFDEIATKVLSEDDMTVEGTSEAASLVKSKSHGSAPSSSGNAKLQDKTANGATRSGKAVVLDESTKGGGVLLGLSDYDTDDDGDDENASTDRIKQTLEPETNNLSSLMQKDEPSEKNLGSYEESTELIPRREDLEVPSHSEGIINTVCEEEPLSKEELHVKTEIGQTTEGEVSLYGSIDGNDDMEKSKVMVDSEDGFKDKIERSKEGDRGDLRDIEGKSKEEKDERIDGNDNRVNIAKDKRQRNREDDRETERRDDKESKLDGLKGNKREITKEEKERITERDGKEDKREKSKEEKERKTERRDDKEDSSKDRRERSREEKERKAERRDDGKWSSRGKSEKSKEERERESDKRDDKDRSRRKRLPSPRGRSRSKERSRSSREQSDNSKRRRIESNRRSMSRSPPRSRHRRDSRSPHSKHSNHRNSAYSTSDRRRSRSRTPTRRRRSRSRTPSRR